MPAHQDSLLVQLGHLPLHAPPLLALPLLARPLRVHSAHLRQALRQGAPRASRQSGVSGLPGCGAPKPSAPCCSAKHALPPARGLACLELQHSGLALTCLSQAPQAGGRVRSAAQRSAATTPPPPHLLVVVVIGAKVVLHFHGSVVLLVAGLQGVSQTDEEGVTGTPEEGHRSSSTHLPPRGRRSAQSREGAGLHVCRCEPRCCKLPPASSLSPRCSPATSLALQPGVPPCGTPQ